MEEFFYDDPSMEQVLKKIRKKVRESMVNKNVNGLPWRPPRRSSQLAPGQPLRCSPSRHRETWFQHP